MPQPRHFAVWPENRPKSLPPVAHSVYENLVRSAARAPDRVAISYYGGQLRYDALLRQVRQLAGYLHHAAGVGRGDRVALYMQNAPQFVIGYYAILAANGVVVPVNPMSRAAELDHVLKDSGASAILFGDELADAVADAAHAMPDRCKVAARYADYIDTETDLPLPDILRHPAAASGIGTSWDAALGAGYEPPVPRNGPDDWCIIPYSSGSTGQPKGCLHTHRSVNAVIKAYPVWFGIKEGSRVLATLPFCHVTGMQHSMNVPLATGASLYLTTRWNAALAATLIERERIAHWRSITTMMIDFLSLPDIAARDLSSLEAIGGGGAQMPQSAAETMQRLLGLPYVEAYGLSETMAPTHINPPDRAKPQCLGIPIFDVDSRIIDPETGQELGPHAPGEIVTNAPQVFSGYWQRPEETRSAFITIDGKPFLRTGDIGYVDNDGYFHFVDRLKRMVNVGGLKVWPAEVEAILHGHDAIEEACIVADPDDRTGEAVRAVLVLRPGHARPCATDLQDWCRARMATYKVPKRFDYRDALPRSVAGKVLWKAL